ncbi:MAG TPA: hypothetical protein VFI03_01420 [Solirubrobacterales bacterium]|nr:hypothetical protein [Solirubrobacterales bacterium]
MVALLTLAGAHTASAQSPSTSSQLLREWANWPYLSYCGGEAIAPVPLFSGPAGAENGSLPSEIGLREVLADPEISWIYLARTGYRLLAEDADSASFVSGELGAGTAYLALRKVGEQWKFGGSGPCFLGTAIGGVEAVNWGLAADQPGLRAETRRIRVNLGPGACSSGMSQNARARKPIFRQLGRRLLMTIVLKPLPPGLYTCQGISDPPLTVTLPDELGRRKLYDGGSFPPRAAADTRPLAPNSY